MSAKTAAAEEANSNIKDVGFIDLPAPPASYNPHLQWIHPEWNKLANNKYVLTRAVREEFYEAFGIYSTFNEDQCGGGGGGGVPKLLNRTMFIKYCYYYMSRSELHTDNFPEGYIPIAYEKDDESKRRWRERLWMERYREQYFDNSAFEEMMRRAFPKSYAEENKKQKRVLLDVKSQRNQDYIKAVKLCQPDVIRALFDKGVDDLCPNCLELFADERNFRRGVVYYAMENTIDDMKDKKDNNNTTNRTNALECLRLVCSLDGVDANADTWYTNIQDGPPLQMAMNNRDIEVAKILLDAGARTTYPDVLSIGNQWAAVVKPYEYSKEYKTAIHHLLVVDVHDNDDEYMSNMLKVLLDNEREGDLLIAGLDGGTVYDLVGGLRGEFRDKHPLVMKILDEAYGNIMNESDKSEESYAPSTKNDLHLKVSNWAEITALDKSTLASISQYMDIFQWSMIKETSKALRYWPKPPSPSIDYHLILFYVHDRYSAYFGFAKTMNSLMEGFKYADSNIFPEGSNANDIGYRFIRIKDHEEPIIPLIQYKNSENGEDPYLDWLSQIHPVGEKYFGVTEAGENLPKGGTLKRMMSKDISDVYVDNDGPRSNAYDGVWFDDEADIACFAWFKDTKPSADINLRHLRSEVGEYADDHMPTHTGPFGNNLEEATELWLNGEEPNESQFHFGADNSWALSLKSTYLWRS